MRAGRLLQLVLLLQRRGRMTAREIAAELEVSERTVFRDVEALSGSGVPVYGVRGPDGGFELLDGFDRSMPVPQPRAPVTTGRARVLLSPSARRLAALLARPEGMHERPLLPVPEERAGWIEVSIRLPSVESTVHDLLALGPGVEVLRPAELRDQLHRAAAEIAEANRGAPAIRPR